MHEEGASPGVTLRQPRPGELGWIVEMHRDVYSRHFGWGEDFDSIVAGIVSGYALSRDGRQYCWIADLGGEPVGCVMLTHDPDGTARLRVMLVVESAQHRGIGRLLAEKVLATARACGDREVLLWTTDKQVAARRLYKALGFQIVSTEPNTTFAPGATNEFWRLEL